MNRALPGEQRVSPTNPSPSDRSAERFLAEQMHGELVEAEHLARYMWAAAYAQDRRVLDAGCGTGYGVEMLLEEGAERYVGIDNSQEAIQAARERYGDDGAAEFVVADVTELPFQDDAFDMVVCFEAIEHVTNQSEALREFKRVLRSGGLLLASSPNRNEYPPGNPHHERELSHQELLSLLSERFANVVPMRQHNWLAAAILGDPDFADQDPQRPLQALLRKAVGRDPGAELYTLAMCSDGPLPERSQAVMLTHGLEVRRWLEQLNHTRDELLKRGDELRQAREALAAAESELFHLRDQTSTIVARAQQRTYWLDRAQIDLDRWAETRLVRIAYRILRGLRTLRSLLRRLTTR